MSIELSPAKERRQSSRGGSVSTAEGLGRESLWKLRVSCNDIPVMRTKVRYRASIDGHLVDGTEIAGSEIAVRYQVLELV